MTWRRRIWTAIALTLLCAPAVAAELPAVRVRTGSHPGFGRMVFDLPPGASAKATQLGDHTLIKLAGVGTLGFGPLPRNVRAARPTPEGADITFAAGAKLRQSRIGAKLVLDVLDPAIAALKPLRRRGWIGHVAAPDSRARQQEPEILANADAPVAPPTATAAPLAPAADATIAATVADATIAATVAAPSAATVAAPSADIPGVMALIARPEASAAPGAARAITLPFSANVGAAAFRRGDAAYVVFDERRPIDLVALHDDRIFGAAAVTVLPGATVLRLPLAAKDGVALTLVEHGWQIAVVVADANPTATRPIATRRDHGHVLLAADLPGRVVTVPDPLTGGLILVGTQLHAGQGMPVERLAPEFTLLASWQGVAVVPRADALALRPQAGGFELSLDGDRPLALSDATLQTAADTDAQRFSRRFDFPDLPIDALRRREQSAVAVTAVAPSQDRGPKRIEAAQTMVALGLAPEAGALLTLTGTEDARLADNPDRIGLAAIAGLLAGRPENADGLDDPRLDGTDEIVLWRAVRQAMAHEGAPAAAAAFAAVGRLALAYPAPLRSRLMPLIAETMALGGEAQDATVLTKTNLNDDSMDFARALLAASIPDQTDRALQRLDRLATSRDRLLRTRAAERAIELRLERHMLTPAQAADAMDPQIYAWRGDQRELDTRLRVAELRADAGQWRQALALLRETKQMWPDDGISIKPRLLATFTRALANDSEHPLPPLDLIALTEENADLIPPGEAGRAVILRLCDRLIALDLPQRAIPLLTKLIASAPAGDARAELGAQLAAMQMQAEDPQAALAALADTLEVGTMPSDLLERRTLTYATATAAIGQPAQAMAALDALGTLAAVKLQADLAEAGKDAPAAVTALQHLVAMAVPASGPLNETHGQILLRFAAAAAQTGRADLLATLRTRDLPRLPTGQMTELMRGLTGAPVQLVTDLPRAAREVRQFGDVAGALKGLAAP